MKRAEAAVRHYERSGKLRESVAIARGQLPVPKIREDSGPQTSKSQRWFVSDEDKANRLMQYVENFLGDDVSCSVETYTADGQSGYAVTVSGTYSESDVANVISSLGGFQRLDQQPGDTD